MNEDQAETPVVVEEVKKFRLQTVISDTDVITLRKESEPVAFVLADNSGSAYLDKDTEELIRELKTYIVKNDGLGMAAIQLGIAKRVFVMRRPFNSEQLVTFINPSLVRGRGRSIKAENCFSIPNLPNGIKGARVKRMTEIFVNYTDEQGVEQKDVMLVGMDARVFLHELDHLNGELMLDDQTATGRFTGWERSF